MDPLGTREAVRYVSPAGGRSRVSTIHGDDGSIAVGYQSDRERGLCPCGCRRRSPRRLVAAVLTTAGALVVLVVVFSGGLQGLRRHRLVTTVAELFLILTVGRLLWTTRPPRAQRTADP
jgi:hypothetical protein